MEIQNQNSDFFHQKKEFFSQEYEFFEQSEELFPRIDEMYNNKYIITPTSAHGNHSRKLFAGYSYIVIVIVLVIFGISWSNSGYGSTLKYDFATNNDYNYFYNSDSYDYNIERITYVVQAGDTLWDIAKRYMGDGLGYHAIAVENHLNNPDLIFPGDVLIIPIVHLY